MKALVVYESMYGNTRHIADAIAEGLRWSIPTEVVLAHDAGSLDLDEVELVVAGAPTHAWGLSRKRTREGAALDAIKHPGHLLESVATKTGVREWLNELKPRVGVRGVAFDTRFDRSKLVTGSAARAIQRGLHRAGLSVIVKPQSFVVTGMAGPLAAGEIERANQWGEELGRIIARVTETQLTPEKSGR
jgi:hypothetical protein